MTWVHQSPRGLSADPRRKVHLVKDDAAVAIGDAVIPVLAVTLLRQETTTGAEPRIPISSVVGGPSFSRRPIAEQLVGVGHSAVP